VIGILNRLIFQWSVHFVSQDGKKSKIFTSSKQVKASVQPVKARHGKTCCGCHLSLLLVSTLWIFLMILFRIMRFLKPFSVMIRSLLIGFCGQFLQQYRGNRFLLWTSVWIFLMRLPRIATNVCGPPKKPKHDKLCLDGMLL
jgi:hypothetical protein